MSSIAIKCTQVFPRPGWHWTWCELCVPTARGLSFECYIHLLFLFHCHVWGFFLSIIAAAMFWNQYSPPVDLLLCCVCFETARAAYQWDLGWNKRSPGIFVSQSHHLSFVSLESCQSVQKTYWQAWPLPCCWEGFCKDSQSHAVNP